MTATATTNPQTVDFANRETQLIDSINRTGKSANNNLLNLLEIIPTTPNSILASNTVQSLTPKSTISKTELEKGKQDIESINNDLKLLSVLLGRPISEKDLPNILAQQNNVGGSGFGGFGSRGQSRRPIISSTTTNTPRTTPLPSTTTLKPSIAREVQLLQSLLKTQTTGLSETVTLPTTKRTTLPATITGTTLKPALAKEVELLQTLLKNQNSLTTASTNLNTNYYGKTDDALLATLLKQQGIGPAHNNVPDAVVS